MADITAGLPTLRPEDLQAQQERARQAALGTAAPLTYGTEMGNVGRFLGNAAVNAAGAGMNFVFNKPGGGGVLDPNRFIGGPALPTLQANTGGATGSYDAPAIDPTATAKAIPAPVQTAAAPAVRTPTTGGRNTASMPAGAPAPLVPGETGFFMGDQLVPYGTRFLVSGGGNVQRLDGGGGGGGVSMEGLPGGGKMVNGRFADPRDALEYGFRLQSQFRDESMRAILANAGNGGDLGFRAKISALAQAFGTNNFGATSVGGANALNQAIAHVAGSEISAGGTVGAAQLGADAQQARTTELARQFDNTPRPIGATSVTDTATGLTSNQTHYGMPAKAQALTPIDAALPKAKPKEGETGKSGGRAVVFKNGEWQLAK